MESQFLAVTLSQVLQARRVCGGSAAGFRAGRQGHRKRVNSGCPLRHPAWEGAFSATRLDGFSAEENGAIQVVR